MSTGHPPPDPHPLRTRLVQRLAYLDDLLRGGLDEYFTPQHDPDLRLTFRARIQEYVSQVEALIAKLPDTAKPEQVLMDIPVAVRDEETGDIESLTVVGPEEVDTMAGKISFLSPLGSALLLRRPQDTVLLEAPGGQFKYQVVNIGDTAAGQA